MFSLGTVHSSTAKMFDVFKSTVSTNNYSCSGQTKLDKIPTIKLIGSRPQSNLVYSGKNVFFGSGKHRNQAWT